MTAFTDGQSIAAALLHSQQVEKKTTYLLFRFSTLRYLRVLLHIEVFVLVQNEGC